MHSQTMQEDGVVAGHWSCGLPRARPGAAHNHAAGVCKGLKMLQDPSAYKLLSLRGRQRDASQ